MPNVIILQFFLQDYDDNDELMKKRISVIKLGMGRFRIESSSLESDMKPPDVTVNPVNSIMPGAN